MRLCQTGRGIVGLLLGTTIVFTTWFASAQSTLQDLQAHGVVAGDTLGAIAFGHGCTVAELKEANQLPNDMIHPGQRLQIPLCGQQAVAEGANQDTFHLVTRGETLNGLAKQYGTSVEAIQKSNELSSSSIRACKILKVTAHTSVRPRLLFEYQVGAGDTLFRIARRFRTRVKELKCLNPILKRHRYLRVGDTLNILRYGPKNPSHAIGAAFNGKLVHGEQLSAGPGYFRRRPWRSWGTNDTIEYLLEAIEGVRRAHRRSHDVAIGDISSRHGGPLPPHKSHQSGRDVDLGFYFKGQARSGPKGFISGLKQALDMEANWTFLSTLLGTSPRQSKAQYIFLDYKLQRRFYRWALKKGISKKTLAWMFQYPTGKRALKGIIRHQPGHGDHYHIRFRCPSHDANCI